jgi:acetyltransferase-like isoleucine patch superfamily enzyme
MNPSSISIGNKTVIEKEATLYSIEQFANKRYNGKISIGNNVYINHHFNVTCANCVDIKDDVLIAYNVSIFDFDHDYEDINSNINKTDLIVKGPIIIDEKSWIGMNVAILGKVTIGKHCIIGANSVVIKDIPDYSVAVGNPARVIKSYNKETNKWEKVAE